MPTSTSFAPADTRSAQRASAHTFTAPVVREQPRPAPLGIGSTAW
jgi:hypothetical protein